MNDIRQEIEAIFKHRKVEQCAAAMGVARSTAYRYQQPLNAHGEVIPLMNLMALFQDVKESGNLPALKAAYRTAQIIVKPLGAVAVDRDLLKSCLEGVPMPALIPAEVTELCKSCEEPVRYLPVCDCRWSKR